MHVTLFLIEYMVSCVTIDIKIKIVNNISIIKAGTEYLPIIVII